MINLKFWKKDKSITISIPSSLTEYTKGMNIIQSHGTTISDVLKNIIKSNEKLKEHIFDGNWNIRDHIKVYVDGKQTTDQNLELNSQNKINLIYELSDSSLSQKEKERYARHILLPEIGKSGQ